MQRDTPGSAGSSDRPRRPGGPRTRRRSSLLVTSALLAGVAGVAVPTVALPSPALAATSAGVTIPAFYDPPASLPAANGRLIRAEEFPLGVSLSLPGMSGPLPARAARIMYTTTDSTGARVAVTGAYLEPTSAWTGSGARPLVTFADGTMGQGDQCAPSLGLQTPVTVNSDTVVADYEIPSTYSLLSKGIAVVVTDYVGLGTTDRLHTYINRVDQGHAVLDAARAVRQLPGISVTAASKVAAYGYSQGGSAAASAAELQPTYAPDVPLVAAYAGAPAADLKATLDGIDGTSLAGAIGWAINGFAQSSPAVRTLVDREASASGKAVLQRLKTMCTVDAVLAYGFQKSSSWTTSGRSIGQILAADPAASALVAAQRIGGIKPTVPVRVATGTLDDLVAHKQARQLAVDWCGRGARVDYEPIIQMVPGGGTGLNHILPIFQDAGPAQDWIVDRFNGKTASSDCLMLPLMP